MDPYLEDEANRIAAAWTGSEYHSRGESLRLSASQAGAEVDRIIAEHAGEHNRAGGLIFGGDDR